METLIATSLSEKSARASAPRFFFVLFSACMMPLLVLGILKVGFEDRFAPRNAGISGLLATDQDVDLLFIGSSHTRQSYDVAMVEHETGASSFLVAYDGTDLVTIDQVISFLGARNRCPRHVVVEAYSAFLSRPPDFEDPRLFFDAPPPLKEQIVSTYLSTHKRTDAYLDVFDLATSRGSESLLTYPANRLVLERLSYHGGTVANTNSGVSRAEFNGFRPERLSGQPDPHQLAAANHLVDFARSRGIQLIFIESPLPAPVGADSRIQALKSAFRTWTEAHNQPYIDGDRLFPTNDPTLFADSNHLSSAGRRLFTQSLAGSLRQWLGRSSERADLSRTNRP